MTAGDTIRFLPISHLHPNDQLNPYIVSFSSYNLVESMDKLEIPEYFLCPISLQIMKDPVTAPTGITYDRENIEHWLFNQHNTTCPVTKLPLPANSELTPNHTLRRLILAWTKVNDPAAAYDIVGSPNPPLTKSHVLKLIRNLSVPNLQSKALQQLEAFAFENEANRKHMVENGVVLGVLYFIVGRYKKKEIDGLEEALRVIYVTRNQVMNQKKMLQDQSEEIIEALTWILSDYNDPDLSNRFYTYSYKNHTNSTSLKSYAILVMKLVIQKSKSGTLERVKPEFLDIVLSIVRGKSTLLGLTSALQIALEACSSGRNRIAMVESGWVFELIELELKCPEKRITKLIFEILFHLCSCADGRAKFLSHAAGVAVLGKRLLRVSTVADDRAVLILSLICKYSAADGVAQEFLKVGVAAKLCMVLQANCAPYLKEKAREILRAYSHAWKDSPCIEISTLSRYVN